MSVLEPVTTAEVATAPPRALRFGPAALLSAALLASNGLAYAFTVLAARSLAPGAYGELAALLGLVLVGAVPATGLQTSVAIRLGGVAEDRRADEVARLHTTALVTAVGVAAVGLLAVGPVVALLHLPEAHAVGWLVALLVAHTLFGMYEGTLQGTGRYGRLAVAHTVFGVGKTVGGLAGLVLGGSPTSAIAGLAFGALAGAAAGWIACDRPSTARGISGPARAAGRAAGAVLGFVLLVNLDVLLARHFMPGAPAGEYAVGAVFAKIAFWLPQGVGMVLLPRLADAGTRRRSVGTAVAVVGAVGAPLVALTALLGDRALPLVGGSAYGGTLGGHAWLFALLGTLLATAQLLLYSGIAAADRFSVAAVWVATTAEVAAVAALAAAGLLTPAGLLLTTTAVAVLLVGAGLLRWRDTGRPQD